MRWVRGAALVLLIVAVPLFLVTTNLRVVIGSGWLYSFGFERHGVAARTGMEKAELMRVSREIKGYFSSAEEPLSVRAVVDGRERELFIQREVRHMADVKGLVRGLAFWQKVSFFTMVGVAVGGLFLWGRLRALHLLARGLLRGSALTVGLLVVLGVGSLVGFEALFTQFHVLGFSNDLWKCGPADLLCRIFPQGFFQDATLIVAGLVIAQAALTGAAAGVFLFRGRRAGAEASALQGTGRGVPAG